MKFKIYLASRSPRRGELLGQIGIGFDVLPSDVDESVLPDEAPEHYVMRLAKEKASEVIPWLRALGFRADQARHAAERCESIPDASLEERVRVAVSSLGPKPRCVGRAAPA